MKIFNQLLIGCTLAGSLFLASCSSCSNEKKADIWRSSGVADTVPTFCKEDTTEVLQMAETYLTHLKNKQYDAALSMLHEIVNDSVKPISQEDKQNILRQQEVFPVLDYHLESYEFVNEHKVQLTFSIEFFKKENENDPIQNTIRINFAPQRINATWYLTLMNKSYVTMLNSAEKTVLLADNDSKTFK